MSKDKNWFNKQLKLNIIVICIMAGFGGYLIYDITDYSNNQFDNGNATSDCILSARVISAQNTTINDMVSITGYLPKAKASWIKYNCNNVLLTDDFQNTCYGSTGFTFYGLTKDQMGLWYCSNISKPTTNNNLVNK